MNKGCVNHLATVRVLYTVAEVVLALGDTEEVATICGATQGAVKAWRKSGRIPHEYESIIRDSLASRRYAAPPTMFTAPGRWERFRAGRAGHVRQSQAFDGRHVSSSPADGGELRGDSEGLCDGTTGPG
jgi:hypothetical protein